MNHRNDSGGASPIHDVSKRDMAWNDLAAINTPAAINSNAPTIPPVPGCGLLTPLDILWIPPQESLRFVASATISPNMYDSNGHGLEPHCPVWFCKGAIPISLMFKLGASLSANSCDVPPLSQNGPTVTRYAQIAKPPVAGWQSSGAYKKDLDWGVVVGEGGRPLGIRRVFFPFGFFLHRRVAPPRQMPAPTHRALARPATTSLCGMYLLVPFSTTQTLSFLYVNHHVSAHLLHNLRRESGHEKALVPIMKSSKQEISGLWVGLGKTGMPGKLVFYRDVSCLLYCVLFLVQSGVSILAVSFTTPQKTTKAKQAGHPDRTVFARGYKGEVAAHHGENAAFDAHLDEEPFHGAVPPIVNSSQTPFAPPAFIKKHLSALNHLILHKSIHLSDFEAWD
ncbi:hypothetical protein MKZ38_000518 [Zalerion maritima]|uniref:Uncharacterized protein n=1 Tax=Zalerion maritima TaxID=339359 RepID=A0AAD5RFQ6_9PEZI|nr:hypothetical protein MKZ38_000518 [Zalerion maritima]